LIQELEMEEAMKKAEEMERLLQLDRRQMEVNGNPMHGDSSGTVDFNLGFPVSVGDGNNQAKN